MREVTDYMEGRDHVRYILKRLSEKEVEVCSEHDFMYDSRL